MKLVIDIPEDEYERLQRDAGWTNLERYREVIKNGTPLPDGAKILTKEAYSDLCLRASKAVTDAVDRVTIKEYLESFSKDTNEKDPCDDCISRSAVLAIAGDSCLDLNSYEDTREFCDEINDLPPVKPPHPKVGHWISLDTGKPSHLKDGMTTEGVKCSECGEWLIASVEYACYGRYCPNCGSYNGGSEE